MRSQNIIRAFFFAVFFFVGTATITVSILFDEITQYYRNKQNLQTAQRDRRRLQSLNDDYSALLQQLQTDPDILTNIAPATLGNKPNEPNTVYPAFLPEQLTAAKKVLTAQSEKNSKPKLPDWIIRCSQPHYRWLLFLSGSVLILTAFVCFGSTKPTNKT